MTICVTQELGASMERIIPHNGGMINYSSFVILLKVEKLGT